MDAHPTANKNTPLLVAGDNSALRNHGSKYGNDASNMSERGTKNAVTASVNGKVDGNGSKVTAESKQWNAE